VTPLYPQKLALTSPTGGGRSVGIVRSRTKATEFLLPVWLQHKTRTNTIKVRNMTSLPVPIPYVISPMVGPHAAT